MPVIFENAGTLDDLAMFTMGLNAKENNEAIGFFGTGLKYAVAIITRLGGRITIQPGDGASYRIIPAEQDFRGKQFTFMTYRDKQLPFTTELGKNWKTWQAYRELRTNALDEGGQVFAAEIIPAPVAGTVRIIVQSMDIEDAHFNSDKYFWSDRNEVALDEGVSLKRNGSGRVFYRGIFVHQLDGQGKYDYNIKYKLNLTEDRTVDGESQIASNIILAMQSCADKDLQKELMTTGQDTPESQWYWSHSMLPFGPAWELAKELYSGSAIINMPQSLVQLISRMVKKAPEFIQETITPADQQVIDRVLEIFAERGWEMENVHWKVRISEKVFGLAHANQIYIGSLAFEQGFRQVLITCVEEYLHQRYKVEDYSRGFQDKALTLLAIELEK